MEFIITNMSPSMTSEQVKQNPEDNEFTVKIILLDAFVILDEVNYWKIFLSNTCSCNA